MSLMIRLSPVSGVLLALVLSACTNSHFEPLEVQGRPAMVEDGGKHRLWVLEKQEEVRQVSVGGSRRSSGSWRSDTYFHFMVQAFDPSTARPLWRRRLMTLGDKEAKGRAPSRVIGSDVEAQLLGQEGDRVWLLIGNTPLAISANDGKLLADAAAIEQRNPALKGLLPSESKFYSFDHGLVFMTADARRVVIRGADLGVADYVPAPVQQAPADTYANGRARIVPMLPYGDVPLRRVNLGGQWLALYTEREVAEALHDEFGDRFRYPYTVLDEGANARRTFWHGTVVDAQRFDDRFQRWGELKPVTGSTVFLKGRFFKDPATSEPLVVRSPDGLLVWHSTRIDQAGRLAMTRVDASLNPVWKAELPLSEPGTGNRLSTWLLPDRLVAMGLEESVIDGVTRHEPRLVSLDLRTGQWVGWNLPGEHALP